MKHKLIVPVIIFILCAFTIPLYANPTGTQKIKDNIDKKLKDIDINSLSMDEKKGMLADQVRLNINMLVPIYGSYVLDNKLYGNIRPPAIIFDWALGGIIPLGLVCTSLIWKNRFSKRTVNILQLTALGLYLATRIGVLITINEHIHQYNKYMEIRLNINSETEKDISMGIGFKKHI